MSVAITETLFRGWRGVEFSAGDVGLIVAPDIGGRIISLTFQGRELFFVQREHEGEAFDFSEVKDLDQLKSMMGFRLWGGDKTWVAPQSDWTRAQPPLELDAGAYAWDVTGDTVEMISPVCRETGLRITRRVRVDKSGEIHLSQCFTNMSSRPVRRGIWNVTQVLRPFDVYLPIALAEVRGYENEGDSAELKHKLLSEGDGWTRIPCHDPVHFKFGAVLTQGLTLALRYEDGDTLALLRRFQVPKGAAYLHEANAEVYNSPDYDYLEIETHGPFEELAPGQRCQHDQNWLLGRFSGNRGPNEALRLLLPDDAA